MFSKYHLPSPLQKGSYPYLKSNKGAAYRITKEGRKKVKQLVLPRYTLVKPSLRVGVSIVKQLVLLWWCLVMLSNKASPQLTHSRLNYYVQKWCFSKNTHSESGFPVKSISTMRSICSFSYCRYNKKNTLNVTLSH